MRAAFMPGAGRIEVDDFPVPEPAGDEVLVEMRYASVCGSDLHIVFDGMHVPERLGQPGYPGHEGVGVVVGSRDSRLPEGTAVLTVPPGRDGGCFAEFQKVRSRYVIPLPERDGTELRKLLPAQQLGTTIFALKRFLSRPETRDGSTAAIIGAGSAGLYFLQQLLRHGYETVVVADLDAERLREAGRLGATHLVHCPAESLSGTVREVTDGLGADLVIEAAGYDACRAEAVEAVRVQGTVGLFGYPERPGLAPFPVDRAFRKGLSVEWCVGAQSEPGLASFRAALDQIRRNEITVDHCLRTSYALEDTPEALAVARAHGNGAAKVNVTLPAGALPAGALPAGALPAGALPAGSR